MLLSDDLCVPRTASWGLILGSTDCDLVFTRVCVESSNEIEGEGDDFVARGRVLGDRCCLIGLFWHLSFGSQFAQLGCDL